uniref:Glycosyltransferase n=1 Tax=Candidatus Methanomethylicus mesodigestus TaxID=1867258 RepID=A0A7C3IXW3_9CREN
MHILVLQESNWIERGPHQQHHLMERLRLKGHEVTVIDYDILWFKKDHRSLLKKAEYLTVAGKVKKQVKLRLVRPAILQLGFLCYLSIPFTHGHAILKEIKRAKPDIVISFGILNGYVGQLISNLFGIPFVCYLIDHLHALLPLKAAVPIAKCLEKRVIKNSEKVFVINKGLKEYAISMGAKDGDVVVIPGGVDHQKYVHASSKRNETRAKYGISEDSFVIFFMGWIYPFSGIKEVAATLLKWDGPHKFTMMVVGDGDALPDLQRLRHAKKMDNLLLLGKQPFDEMPRLLAAADICILPAYVDAPEMQNIVPIKLYEYLAAGKPVVSTRLPGIVKEFGYDNWVFYVSAPEEVIPRCASIIEKMDLKEEGENIVRASSKFDWKYVVECFEDELELLCRKTGLGKTN